MDRISNLPDDMIHKIGSFLSAKDVAFTSLLSKRWQTLFTILHKVEFDDTVDENQETFKDFLDRVINLPLNHHLRNFSLKCRKDIILLRPDTAHIDRCLCNVLKRGVIDLTLNIKVEEVYSLPFELFISKSLVKLNLATSLAIDFLPHKAFLPSLKTLIIDSIRCDFMFPKLYPHCPVLEGIELGRVGAAMLLQYQSTELYSKLISLRRLNGGL